MSVPNRRWFRNRRERRLLLLSSYIHVALNLLIRLSLVLPQYFVLVERGTYVLVMSSEDCLRVVSFGDRYYYSYSYPNRSPVSRSRVVVVVIVIVIVCGTP